MKAMILLFLIQIFAFRLAFAVELEPSNNLSGPTLADIQASKLDDCKEILPKLQAEFANFDLRFQENAMIQRNLNDQYMDSFNQMTATLFQVTDEHEKETGEMTEAKLSLRESINVYNSEKTVEKAKPMQENYAQLAEKIYFAASEAQKKINRIREAYAVVEKTRNDYEKAKADLVALEHQKLNLESQIASQQLRCQTRL
jgi:hypothetical protein